LSKSNLVFILLLGKKKLQNVKMSLLTTLYQNNCAKMVVQTDTRQQLDRPILMFLNQLRKIRGNLYKRPIGPVLLKCFHLQNCLKVFATPETLFNKLESPCLKDTPCQISMHSGQWFMKRRFLKIYPNFPYSAPLLEQI